MMSFKATASVMSFDSAQVRRKTPSIRRADASPPCLTRGFNMLPMRMGKLKSGSVDELRKRIAATGQPQNKPCSTKCSARIR